jgi:hypothetical protein
LIARGQAASVPFQGSQNGKSSLVLAGVEGALTASEIVLVGGASEQGNGRR